MQARDEILRGLAEITALHAAAAAIAQRIYSVIVESEHRPLCSDRIYHDCGSRDTGDGDVRVDAATCSVEWEGHRCVLGPSLLFRMIHRLSRQPNRFFAYDTLMDEVWQRRCSDEAVRTLIKRLRRALADADMGTLASSIQVRGRCLGLFLDGRAP